MEKTIKRIAQEHNTSPASVEADMKEAIHAAYLNRTPAFIALFGDREPTVEEFVKAVTEKVTGPQ